MPDNQFQLGNNKDSTVHFDNIKGGIKRADIDSKFFNIFDKYDNGNEILTDDEILIIKNDLQQAANPNNDNNDSIFSVTEAEAYLKSDEKTQNDSADLLFDFLKLLESKTKNVISSTVDEETQDVITIYKDNNGQNITEKYNNSTQITEILVSVNGQIDKKNISETIKEKDKKFTVYYDGNGNTKGVTVQQEETIEQIAQHYSCNIEDLILVNLDKIKGKKPNQYFLAGEEIKIPGEIKAKDFEELNKGRKSSEEIKNLENDKAILNAQTRMKDKPTQEMVIGKDYPNWEKYTIDFLKSQGKENPTKQEINTTMYDLIALNPDVKIPKKNTKIQVLSSKSPETKEELNSIQQQKISLYKKFLKPQERIKFEMQSPQEQLQIANGYFENSLNNQSLTFAADNTAVQRPQPKNYETVFTKQQKIEQKLETYKNETPEDKKLKQDLIKRLKKDLENAKKLYEEHKKTENWSSITGEFISRLWNNDNFLFGWLNTGNTKKQVEEALNHAEQFIQELESADNSLTGIEKGNDFNTVYERYLGVEFDTEKINNFYKKQEEYNNTFMIYSSNKMMHERFNNAFKNYDVTILNNSANRIEQKQQPLYDDWNERQSEYNAQNEIFTTFHETIGMTKEEFKNLQLKCMEEGTSWVEELRKYANDLMTVSDFMTKELIGDISEEDLKKMKKELKQNQISAFGGDESLTERVEDYNYSQETASAVVSGAAQMTIYAAIMIATGGGAVVSGLAYAGGYLATETANRLTNGIDNKDDLWNNKAMTDILTNTGIEFAAGYIFDIAAVKGVFEKFGKNAVNRLGKSALSTPGVRYNPEMINKMLEKGIYTSTKDGTKEISKQSLIKLTSKQNYSIGDVGIKMLFGFAIGAILGCCKFKMTSSNMYRVVDKSSKIPKKVGTKNESLKINKEDSQNPNLQEDFYSIIKNDIFSQTQQKDPELFKIISEHPEFVDDIIVAAFESLSFEEN